MTYFKRVVIIRVGERFMKKITDYITITELAPLLGVTRPTLYKYMVDYEAGEVRSIKYEIILIFDFITKHASNKVEIIDFITNQKNSGDSDLIRDIKRKIENDKVFKDLIRLLLKSYKDYGPILLDLKKEVTDNGHDN